LVGAASTTLRCAHLAPTIAEPAAGLSAFAAPPRMSWINTGRNFQYTNLSGLSTLAIGCQGRVHVLYDMISAHFISYTQSTFLLSQLICLCSCPNIRPQLFTPQLFTLMCPPCHQNVHHGAASRMLLSGDRAAHKMVHGTPDDCCHCGIFESEPVGHQFDVAELPPVMLPRVISSPSAPPRLDSGVRVY
jgi:hypothetical protein